LLSASLWRSADIDLLIYNKHEGLPEWQAEYLVPQVSELKKQDIAT